MTPQWKKYLNPKKVNTVLGNFWLSQAIHCYHTDWAKTKEEQNTIETSHPVGPAPLSQAFWNIEKSQRAFLVYYFYESLVVQGPNTKNYGKRCSPWSQRSLIECVNMSWEMGSLPLGLCQSVKLVLFGRSKPAGISAQGVFCEAGPWAELASCPVGQEPFLQGVPKVT